MAKYRKKDDQFVTAVKLDLETAGFTYSKWGGTRECNAGDWIVDNAGDVYTIAADTFERTYRPVDGGRYVKTTPVWAEKATGPGHVGVGERVTHHVEGDYLVSNEEGEDPAYAVEAAKFEEMYEQAPDA